MSLHRLRARLDRLEQAVIAALGEDPEKVAKNLANDRQRYALLQDRKVSGAALTGAEQAEFERLDDRFRDEDYARRAGLSGRERFGNALTEAETAELARLDAYFKQETPRTCNDMFNMEAGRLGM
jgi:hypothetical protein